MSVLEASDRLIVGLGSPHGDDQAGWLAVDALSRLAAVAGTFRKASDPTELWAWMTAHSELTLIDACENIAPVGAISRLQWPTDRFIGDGFRTTHGVPLSEILETACRLGTGPSQATIWLIAGRSFASATMPAEEVISAAERLAGTIATEIAHA
jgi:hydrogenase maturation protease